MKNKKTLLVSLLFLTTIATPVVTNNIIQNTGVSHLSGVNSLYGTPSTENYTFKANAGFATALKTASSTANSVSASFTSDSKTKSTLFVGASKTNDTTGTSNGLFYSIDGGIKFKNLKLTSGPILGTITSFYQNSDGVVWIGTTSDIFTAAFNKTDTTWTLSKVQIQSKKTYVSNIVSIKGKMYLVVGKGEVSTYNASGIYAQTNPATPDIFQPQATSGIPTESINYSSIAVDKNGNYWIGTNKGLFYNNTAEVVGTYALINNAAAGLSNTTNISKIMLGSNNDIYAIDANGNAYKATYLAPNWTYVKFFVGKQNQTLSFIFEDKSNNLWMGIVNDLAQTKSKTMSVYSGSINAKSFDDSNKLQVLVGGSGIQSMSEGQKGNFFFGALGSTVATNSLINATSKPSPTSKLTGGAIAGIVIGILSASAIIGLISFNVYKNKAKKPSVKTKK